MAVNRAEVPHREGGAKTCKHTLVELSLCCVFSTFARTGIDMVGIYIISSSTRGYYE